MTKKFQRTKEDFTCIVCNKEVTGNGYTNHCPNCLWSQHVDINPGDRASTCKGLMKPIKLKPKTGQALEAAKILHQCIECGHEKWNLSSKQDSTTQLLTLPIA